MKVLIVGTGGIGKRHIRGFLKTGMVRLSIVEPNETKRREIVETYDIEQDFADLHEINLHDFDAAVICAPPHVHMPIGQTCADAGVPFLMEKPLAVTMDGVDGLIETVNSKNLVARVAYVRRSSNETIQLRERTVNGNIGELRMCYINCSQEYPKYRPDFQTIYYARKETGGGVILDSASHMIDLLLWIMGEVTEVSAMYDRLELPGIEVEDSALISMRFSNGGMAQINMNQFQKPNVVTMEMIGTKGNLVLDSVNGELRWAKDDSGKWEVINVMGGLTPMQVHEERFSMQANLFLKTLAGQPSHLTTLEEARDNLHIVLAAKESYETKRIICLSEKEEKTS